MWRTGLIVGRVAIAWLLLSQPLPAQNKPVDGRNRKTGKPDPYEDPALAKYGIYQATAPRASTVDATSTSLPLELQSGERVALIGNTLFDRARHFGYFETLLSQAFAKQSVVVRNLSWSADTIDLQPRPANFADLDQHLTHERADVVLAAFGFNESFAGKAGAAAFKKRLVQFVRHLKTTAFNGIQAPRVVLVSPIANEDLPFIPAGTRNNANLSLYTGILRQVAADEQVGFVDVYQPTLAAMQSPGDDLTINGIHLNSDGYRRFAESLFTQLFDRSPPELDEEVRQLVVNKSRQYFRRYRPANTFYYTGDRSKSYGYLDFLPAMRNFDVLVERLEQSIWSVAQGEPRTELDAPLPPLPPTKESRGANRWLSAADELAEFEVDPRFEVNLFASEEQFPDIAAPIQMRWDARGRLWVACSTTYPHVYPGQEAADKLVILEDVDGDGRADTSKVFADGLHIPLSFELAAEGVYVSEMPDLTLLQDTDGDDRADVRRRLLTGFGTEDSHHALHDFVWTPDGDLLIRESIFHHSQIETPYGPVRQQSSGWFRFHPRTQRLTSFGTYHSTNPWGVTFDDWGQHVASHPIYAAAFHALDPPYPLQHPKPEGLRAYSGTCGQEFIDFATFPAELQGSYIKARYKPTNRIEIHRWIENDFGFDERYEGDLIFSKNLSFIPVDIGFGPRGALYVCDWYNPIKGHAQYSLRDERRDRHSGRIWRITSKGLPLQDQPRIADASVPELLALLERPEYRVRYWAKRELRGRDPQVVGAALTGWLSNLDPNGLRYRHHQLEAVWMFRALAQPQPDLLRELLGCEHHLARAAAVEQLRYWHTEMSDAIALLRSAANDPSSIVRMQAAIAASYIGTREAFEAILDIYHHPLGGHLEYALRCSLGSASLRRHWETDDRFDIAKRLRAASRKNALQEPPPSAGEAQFDSQQDLAVVRIGCLPERMKFSLEQFTVRPGQPVKLVFSNGDATDHNLLIVRPGSLQEVGEAANAMARESRNANSNFHPSDKRHLILQATPMIGPTRKRLVHVLRFQAPQRSGIYPYVCTFPGHWIIMKGRMVVAETDQQATDMLADDEPQVVQVWKLADLEDLRTDDSAQTIQRGLQAFVKAKCDQCHQMGGHGIALGPSLTDVTKRYRGDRLLEQLLTPSKEIHPQYVTVRFLLHSGKVLAGVIQNETEQQLNVLTNLLDPTSAVTLNKEDIELRSPSRVSSMPTGLLDVLTKDEIADLLSLLQSDQTALPGHHR